MDSVRYVSGVRVTPPVSERYDETGEDMCTSSTTGRERTDDTGLKERSKLLQVVLAHLETTTGSGRADVFYVSHPGQPHRPIDSVHRSRKMGDLYLTYKDAAFSGTVDLDARSFSASGLHDAVPRLADQLPWVGDKHGVDKMVVESKNGWVGLYF